MSHSNEGEAFWLKLWVELVAGITLAVSVGSFFSQMRFGAWVGLAGALIWAGSRIRTARIRISVDGGKGNRLFSFLAGLCFLSLCFGPHCFLDSYSYRIPQMLLWLQEGHPWSVPFVDVRINQMPHVWSFLSTAFFLPLGERGLALPNFISYLLLFRVLKSFAKSVCGDNQKVKWMVLIFMASPVMVMQASSNDNVLSCITLLAISAYFCWFGKSDTRTVVYSALAFALCCGIKPQYVTLAPLWLLWFVWGEKAPLRVVKWGVLFAILPLLIFCSPLPTFTANYVLNGSVTHPVVPSEFSTQPDTVELVDKNETKGLAPRIVYSYVSLANQLLALPVNPLAGKLTAGMHDLTEKHPALKKWGFDRQRVWVLLIAENASLSLFATLSLVLGVCLSKGKPRGYAYLAAGSFVAMSAAIFVTTPGTLGRSFVGFIVLMMPPAFVGLSRLKISALRVVGSACVLMGIGVIIIDPAGPLWPADWVAEHVSHAGLKREMMCYAHYSKRHHSGAPLLDALSPNEPVGLIVDNGMPLARLWGKEDKAQKLIPLPTTVTHAELSHAGIKQLIVRSNALTVNGSTSTVFLDVINGEVVASGNYTSYMQRGPELWAVVKIK
jgi:hypothetical protein